jgi:5'-3' exonuclease
MISFNVDVDEIYDDLTNYEKNELIDLLIEDEQISKNAKLKLANGERENLPIVSLQDEEFSEALDVLYKNRFNLSVEEEEYIKSLAKRYV